MDDPAPEGLEAKVLEEQEAEKELMTWGGSVKGKGRAEPHEAEEAAAEKADLPPDSAMHFAISTPISAPQEGIASGDADKTPEPTSEAPREELNGAAPPPPSATQSLSEAQAPEEGAASQGGLAAPAAAAEYHVGAPPSAAQSVTEEVAPVEHVAEEGELEVSATSAPEGELTGIDVTPSLLPETSELGVDHYAEPSHSQAPEMTVFEQATDVPAIRTVERLVEVEDGHDRHASSAAGAVALPPKAASVGSSFAAPPQPGVVSPRSMTAQLNRLQTALDGVHGHVHRLIADSRCVKLQCQAMDGRQAHLENGHADLGQRLQQLEMRVRAFSEQEAMLPASMPASSQLHDRIAALERDQKTVARGLKRVLQGGNITPSASSAVLQSGYRHEVYEKEQNGDFAPTPFSSPMAGGVPGGAAAQIDEFRDRIHEHERRLAELDAFCAVARMELRAPRQAIVAPASPDESTTAALDGVLRHLDEQAVDLASLRRDVDALLEGALPTLDSKARSIPEDFEGQIVHQPIDDAASVASGASAARRRLQLQRQQQSPKSPQSPQEQQEHQQPQPQQQQPKHVGSKGTRLLSQEQLSRGLRPTSLELRFDARLEAGLEDLGQRIEMIRQAVDQRLQLRLGELSQQATARLETIAGQCQDCFAKVEAHEVTLSIFSTSLELQERRLHNVLERVDRTVPTAEAARVQREAAIASATTVLTGRVDAHAKAIEDLRDRIKEMQTPAWHTKIISSSSSSHIGSHQVSRPQHPQTHEEPPIRHKFSGSVSSHFTTSHLAGCPSQRREVVVPERSSSTLSFNGERLPDGNQGARRLGH